MPNLSRLDITHGLSATARAGFTCCAPPMRRRINRTFCSRSAQDELSRTLFPLGAMTKTEVRARAGAGLANADKPESQEICFVPDGDYASFVERRARNRTEQFVRGRFSTPKATRSRNHPGIHRFTVGQRRGLGIATGEALYVREIQRRIGRRDRRHRATRLMAPAAWWRVRSAWSIRRRARSGRDGRRSEDPLSASRAAGDAHAWIRRAAPKFVSRAAVRR